MIDLTAVEPRAQRRFFFALSEPTFEMFLKIDDVLLDFDESQIIVTLTAWAGAETQCPAHINAN